MISYFVKTKFKFSQILQGVPKLLHATVVQVSLGPFNKKISMLVHDNLP